MKISSEQLDRVASFGKTLDRNNRVADVERIAGLFPRGHASIVASMAGTGKTWFTEYLACKLSMGGNILSGLVAKSKRMKTVILAGETGTDLLDYRLSLTKWEYDPDRIKAYNAVEMMMANLPCMMNTPEGQQTIITIFAHEKPDIVFIDTLISFHSVDESKQGEMTAIYTFLLRLAKAFNCAVVVNHHTRKRPANFTGKRFTQEDIIGTSAGVRLCACAFVIMAEDTGNGGSTMTVSNVKSWYKKVPEFQYKFVNDEAGLIDFEISFDVDTKNLMWSVRERFAALLKSYENGSMLKVANVAAELGVSTEAMRYYFAEAEKGGHLVKVKILNETAYKVMKS